MPGFPNLMLYRGNLPIPNKSMYTTAIYVKYYLTIMSGQFYIFHTHHLSEGHNELLRKHASCHPKRVCISEKVMFNMEHNIREHRRSSTSEQWKSMNLMVLTQGSH